MDIPSHFTLPDPIKLVTNISPRDLLSRCNLNMCRFNRPNTCYLCYFMLIIMDVSFYNIEWNFAHTAKPV